ncbi:hypothetical protein Vadar_034170 [Vaccinium darrowii]|uniref:Uncharacterized protein n=1 Tax=Vaccinium darrowii TaxID=229202 RepID=A0ACB7YJ13_9ERIC|nr:hypothetical protein Vadar_034170 [Vaccinium darrowii]
MATVNASSISANLNNIPTLTGSNFAKWKEHVSIVLGCMDLDYALRVDEPAKLTDNSTAEEKSIYEKWERSNRMSLMIIKHSISYTIRGAMPGEENAKKFLSQIADRFVASEKVEACTLFSKLVTMWFRRTGEEEAIVSEEKERPRKLQQKLADEEEGLLADDEEEGLANEEKGLADDQEKGVENNQVLSLEELNEGKGKRKMKGWEKGGSGGTEKKQRRGDEGQGKKKMKYWE